MPKRTHFINGMTVYKYCQLKGISYNSVLTRAKTYGMTPDKVLFYSKRKGYTQQLREAGIDKNNKDFSMYYRRLRNGWSLKKALSIPRQTQGGDRRKKLDKY